MVISLEWKLTMNCPACGRREPRSTEQNSRYWKIISLLALKTVSGVKYSRDDWHDTFKMMFLGAEEVKLPNGKVITRLESTTDLDKPAFNDYMTQVEVWANERGVYLED